MCTESSMSIPSLPRSADIKLRVSSSSVVLLHDEALVWYAFFQKEPLVWYVLLQTEPPVWYAFLHKQPSVQYVPRVEDNQPRIVGCFPCKSHHSSWVVSLANRTTHHAIPGQLSTKAQIYCTHANRCSHARRHHHVGIGIFQVVIFQVVVVICRPLHSLGLLNKELVAVTQRELADFLRILRPVHHGNQAELGIFDQQMLQDLCLGLSITYTLSCSHHHSLSPKSASRPSCTRQTALQASARHVVARTASPISVVVAPDCAGEARADRSTT